MESKTKPFEFVIPISYGSTEVFETGRWSFQKPESVLGWAPCEEACPAGNPIPESLHLIEEGQFREALETILLENPFPGTCGRVCYHPCEEECHRKKFDEPVSINDLERFTFDVTLDYDPEFSSFPCRDARRIAIIGAGPCGLSCAYFLFLLGHRVTLFEAEEEPGGILRWGIPEYRLPKDVLRKEVKRILSLGVEMKTGMEVGKSFPFEDLKGFDALFVSPGARGSRSLGVKGDESKRVWKGIEFLRKMNSGRKIKAGGEVIVIGGGNTAIDVARSARRLGCSVLVPTVEPKERCPPFPKRS